MLESIRHYSVLKLALLGLQFVAISTMTGSGSYAALDDSSSIAMLMYNSMTAGFARQAGSQIVDQLLRANPGAFQGITRKPVMSISPITKSVALAELAQFVTAMNAIRPLGDDDLVTIRKHSEILPVTLPEVEEMPVPEMPTAEQPQPVADEPEQPTANEDDTMTTPDEPGELSEPVNPKGSAVTLPDSASKVTPDDAAAAVEGFKRWAKKNAPQYATLLDAEVEGEDES